MPKILHKIHPDIRIGKDAKEQLNMFLNLIIDKIIKKAVFLTKNTFSDKKMMKKQATTMNSRELNAATKIVLSQELAKHAVAKGSQTITKYVSSEKGNMNHPIPKEKRAGLVIPVTRVGNQIKTFLGRKQRISDCAPVFLAGVTEYLAAEVIELAGNLTYDQGTKTITPRNLFLVLANDEELNLLAKKVKFKVSGGGVLPH